MVEVKNRGRLVFYVWSPFASHILQLSLDIQHFWFLVLVGITFVITMDTSLEEYSWNECLGALKTFQLPGSVVYIIRQKESFQNIFQNMGISCDRLG